MSDYKEKPCYSKGKELKDVRKSGKAVPWKSKKLLSLELAERLKEMEYFKKFISVSQCAQVLVFRKTYAGDYRLFQTWFCKDRLCPMCSWRKSLIQSYFMTRVVKEVFKRKPKSRWIFLTLTTKNTFTAKELSKELSAMTKAFREMCRRKAVQKNLLGFYRVTEITVNKENMSYNQHLHALLCVSSSYFKKDNYLNQESWTQLWKHHMKLDYVPVVNIQLVKPKKSKEKESDGLVSAVQETVKYESKSSDYITQDFELDKQVIADLSEALRGKRFSSSSGIIKKVQQELKLKDAEESDDLVNVDGEPNPEQFVEGEILARWHDDVGTYIVDN